MARRDRAYHDESEDVDVDEEAESDEGEEDEYNLRMFGINQALPVPEGPPPDMAAGLPDTAEEYLQWVRYEASRCPQVVRADISTDKMQRSVAGTSSYLARVTRAQAMPDGPDWAQPSSSWVRQLLLDFRTLRQDLVNLAAEHQDVLQQVRLPHAKDLKSWERLCFGAAGDAGAASQLQQQQQQQLQKDQRQQHQQQLQQPQQSSAPQAAQQEAGHSDSVSQSEGSSTGLAPGGSGTGLAPGGSGTSLGPGGRDPEVSAGTGGPGGDGQPSGLDRISGPLLQTVLAMDQVGVVSLTTWMIEGLDGMDMLTHTRSQWLFALAACLEKPVHADTGAAFRSMMRKCCVLRAALQERHDPQLPLLNTLIVLAGGYFGQDERLARLMADEELP